MLLGARRPLDPDLHTPFLCDIEFLNVANRLVRAKALTVATAAAGCADYADLPLTRHGHLPLLGRILELRDNFSAYDAAYVALTEMLDLPFLTGDARLVRAVRRHLPHVVLA